MPRVLLALPDLKITLDIQALIFHPSINSLEEEHDFR